MEHLKFNIHAFVTPSTKAEYIALLDEAIRMAGELHDLIDRWELDIAAVGGTAQKYRQQASAC